MIAQNDRKEILSYVYLLHFFPCGLEKLKEGKTISEPTISASLFFMIDTVRSSQDLGWAPHTGLILAPNPYLKCEPATWHLVPTLVEARVSSDIRAYDFRIPAFWKEIYSAFRGFYVVKICNRV